MTDNENEITLPTYADPDQACSNRMIWANPVRPWQVGDLVKTFDGAFNTGVILEISGVWAKVARPYVYAHDVCGMVSPLAGLEIYDANLVSLEPAEVGRDKAPRQMKIGG